MKEKELDNLIAKWVTGEISSPERKKIEQWMEDHPEQKAQLEKTKLLWDSSADLNETFDVDTDAAWAKVSPQLEKKAKVVPFYQNKVAWAIAASITLLFGLNLIYNIGNKGFTSTNAVAFTSKTEASSTTKSKALEDGSVIELNKGAILSTPNHFDENERHVKLEGEAFFEVKRMPEKPFIIDAGSFAKVQVLGTSFNVKSNKDGSVEVKVITGKVKLYTSDGEVILFPNDVGFYNPVTKTLIKTVNQDLNYDVWRTKRLVFNNTELLKVVEVLNGYYGCNIEITSQRLENMRLTATFSDEPLEQVLELIKESLEIDVIKSGTIFSFTERAHTNSK